MADVPSNASPRMKFAFAAAIALVLGSMACPTRRTLVACATEAGAPVEATAQISIAEGWRGTVWGRVSDARTGDPLPAVFLYMVNDQTGDTIRYLEDWERHDRSPWLPTATTEAYGAYQIINLLPGTYGLTVSRMGYRDYQTVVTLDSANRVRADFSLIPGRYAVDSSLYGLSGVRIAEIKGRVDSLAPGELSANNRLMISFWKTWHTSRGRIGIKRVSWPDHADDGMPGSSAYLVADCGHVRLVQFFCGRDPQWWGRPRVSEFPRVALAIAGGALTSTVMRKVPPSTRSPTRFLEAAGCSSSCWIPKENS